MNESCTMCEHNDRSTSGWAYERNSGYRSVKIEMENHSHPNIDVQVQLIPIENCIPPYLPFVFHYQCTYCHQIIHGIMRTL